MHHTGKGCLLLPVVFNLSISDSWNCDLSLIGIYRILKAQTRKYKLHSNVSLLSVAQRCPPNFTGADIYALCADAWFHAAKRSVSVSALLLCTLVFFLSLLCWTYMWYFQVKTFEIDPSRNNDASAEEVIVEIDDFMTVKLWTILSKHGNICGCMFGNKKNVVVTTQVLGDISPSLSLEELQNYEQLRQKIEGPSRWWR